MVAGPVPLALPTTANRPATSPGSVAEDGFTPIVTADDRARRYAEATRDREYGRLALAPEGDRNKTLNQVAFALGQFTGSGLVDRERTEQDSLQLAERIG